MRVRLKVVRVALSGVLCLHAWGCKGSASVNVNDGSVAPRNDDGTLSTDDPGQDDYQARHIEGHNSGSTPVATLPGFTMNEDGTSRVFLEVSGDVPVTKSTNRMFLSYRFTGVTVPERVNRLPIPTSHFETPVSSIQVVQVAGGAELRIVLRQDTEPKTRVKRSPGGTVLSVDFPRWVPGQQGRATSGQVDAAPSPVQE